MTPVLQRLSQHVGTRPDWPVIQREVTLRHTRLTVKPVSFPGNGRDKRHGKPILELRIQTFDTDPQRVFVKRFDAGKTNAA